MVCVGDGCDLAIDGEDRARVGDLVRRTRRIMHKWVLGGWTIGRPGEVKGGPHCTRGGGKEHVLAGLGLKTNGNGLLFWASKPKAAVC